MAELAAIAQESPFADAAQPGLRYRFSNEMFGHGDGLVLYSMLRHFKPGRVVEVGSGFSSALMLDVNDQWLDSSMQLTFIEPFPDRLNSLLRPEDRKQATVLTQSVQDVDLAVFDQLALGDILFIDSSHVSKAGSDLNHLVFNVLPRLAPGVIIHFHDVFWPFEYPRAWADMGRAWNEDYLLRALLTDNARLEILLFNSYLARVHAKEMAATFPSLSPSVDPGSLWLRVVGT